MASEDVKPVASEQPPVVVAVEEPIGSPSWWVWLIPLAALIAAVALSFQAFSQRGTRIWITFDEGNGLRVGDPVTCRGVQVGRVDDVRLDDSLEHVEVEVVLSPASETLARDGSRFWIVRPEVSLKGVQGLDTLLGPRYIEVLADPHAEVRQVRFEGLIGPPRLSKEVGALEIVVTSKRRWALEPGAPVTYRDMAIGEVVDVQFAQAFAGIDITLSVEPTYSHLVRENSRFWYLGGVGIEFGLLGGLTVRADSLESVLNGGIGLATPDKKPGEPVESGHSFPLANQADSEWLNW